MDYNYTYGKGLDPLAEYRDSRQNLGTDLINRTAQTFTGVINKANSTLNKAKQVVGNMALPGANLGTIAYGGDSDQTSSFNKPENKLNYLNLFSERL